MNGYEMFSRALALGGFSNQDPSASEDAVLLKRAFTALCHICADLGITAPKMLSEKLNVSENTAEVIICGMAMLLAAGEADGEKSQMFTALYNAKRSAVRGSVNKIKDVLPNDDGGVTL